MGTQRTPAVRKYDAEKMRRWRAANPAEAAANYRRQNLWRYYRMTVEEWDRMFDAQGGRCALCLTDKCHTGRRLSVDHDHDTGRIRGLLCYRCNAAIALLEQGVGGEQWIERAVRYLGGD